jgi:hypothetical protein
MGLGEYYRPKKNGRSAALHPAQPQNVFLHRANASERFDAREQVSMEQPRGLREPVMYPEPVFPSRYQTRASKVGEVSGDCRLRKLESSVQVTDADLATKKQIQEPQANRV